MYEYAPEVWFEESYEGDDGDLTPALSPGGKKRELCRANGAEHPARGVTAISASPVESYVPREWRLTLTTYVSWRDRDERFRRMVRVMDPFQWVNRAEDTGEYDAEATNPRIDLIDWGGRAQAALWAREHASPDSYPCDAAGFFL